MNTTVQSLALPAAPVMPLRRVIGAYAEEARSECLRYMRAPAFILPVTIFPALFYLLFGVFMSKNNGPDAARYLLASYGVFGVMSPGLFGFGVSLALERDGGLLTFKRALPMPPGAYLLGKMLMAMLAAGVVIVILMALAMGLGGVSLSPLRMLALLVTGMIGAVPFCALGMWIGTLVKGQGAPGILNLIYLPMSFLSGLWFPLDMLPKVIQQIAPIFPPVYLHKIALTAVGFDRGSLLPPTLILIGFSILFLMLAARRLRRVG